MSLTKGTPASSQIITLERMVEERDAALATANERIRELEAEAEKSGAVALNINADRIALRNVSNKLAEALAGLHQVCEIALAGKDGKQHTYFETRAGHFVEATQAMMHAETALAEVAAIRAKQGGEG